MRSTSERFDAKRSSGIRNVRSKYIFSFEGYSTEVSYFEGLKEYSSIAGIKDIVSICNLQREQVDSGCSDPMSLLKILEENVSAMLMGHHTIGSFCEQVRGEIGKAFSWGRNDPEFRDLLNLIEDSLKEFANEERVILDQNKAIGRCEEIIKEKKGRVIVLSIQDPEEYNPETDHICVLIDRDRDSHDPREIDDFISGCKKKGFEPYITNPCFEFWLLLHFEDVYGIDKERLKKNPMEGDKRFTEVCLGNVLRKINPENHYDKTSLDPLMFMHRLREAVDNSRTFCQELKCLKHEVGTNLGTLFKELCEFE